MLILNIQQYLYITGNIIPSKNDVSTPFNANTEGIDEGKFDQRWIVDYYREPFDNIFNNLETNDGKVVRMGKWVVLY